MTSIRSTRMTRTAAVVATGLVACAPLLATAPAHAKDGRVTASGSCGGPTWKLKAQPDDGRVQIEFEVDSNVVGQTWTVKIADNGSTVFSGTRRTTAPSGSFSVERPHGQPVRQRRHHRRGHPRRQDLLGSRHSPRVTARRLTQGLRRWRRGPVGCPRDQPAADRARDALRRAPA